MYSNILVPISFDEERDPTAALDLARLLSAKGARVTLLHVMEQVPGYAISYLPTGFRSAARQAVEAELTQLATTFPNASMVVIEGHAGSAILNWAKEHGVDCIIISSHRPGMQDLLLGSTATRVVRHAGCAVHVIR